MPKTLSPSDQDKDRLINPNESDELFRRTYGDDVARGIKKLEELKDSQAGESDESISQAEEKGNWRTPFTGTSSYGKKLTGANVRAILKRRGPLGLILTIGLGGGLIGTFLFSPGLLLVQMKESLVERFNVQQVSMEKRSNLLLNKKIAGTFTSGVCTNTVSIRCKFSTLSEKQVARLKTAGVEIADGAKKFGGQIRPGAIIFKGEQTDADGFRARYNTDPDLQKAFRQAYNPRFAGFADEVWGRVAIGKLGLSKVRALPDGDDTAKATAINEQVKSGSRAVISNNGVTCPPDTNRCTNAAGEVLSEEESRAARVALSTVDDVALAIEEIIEEEGLRSANHALESLETAKTSPIHAAGNFIKVTGAIDIGCQAYTSVRALGYAAKTIRAVQLARYAMVFLNTADQIKEGTAKPEDVAYLGGILTSVAYDAVEGAKRKAAMDSFGMQYAMYGTVGPRNSYVSQFMAGGGLTGDLITVTDMINTLTGGTPRTTCAFLSNGWVQVGSLAAGVALMLVPGVGQIKFVAGDVAKAGILITTSFALAVLPELLKDIVAGKVVDGIVGEDSGNGATSGAGRIMSDLAQGGGGAPLSIDDAAKYGALHNTYVAQYAAEDRATLSPLDPSSKHTFVGSIAWSLMPYMGGFSNVSSGLTSVGGIISRSFGSLLPKTGALTNAELEAAYTTCDDYDYSEYLKIATDPFCNPIFGIPTEYLDRDPVEVATELIRSGEMTEDGTPKEEYAEYIEHCIEREHPLGDTGETADGNDGSECKIDNETEAAYYLNYVDQRVETGMDGLNDSGNGAAISKQALAKKIIAKDKVSYWPGNGGVHPTLEDIADGEINASATPCGINVYILRIIDKITDRYSITISDLNRLCETTVPGGVSVPDGSSTSSPHYQGNGSAIDISIAGGKALTGRDGNSMAIINLIMPLLEEAARKSGQNSRIGQLGCDGRRPTIGPGVIQFSDICNHLHIDVPAGADPGLAQQGGG